VETVSGKGYRFLAGDLLSAERIEQASHRHCPESLNATGPSAERF
jgi:hypothetical protein